MDRAIIAASIVAAVVAIALYMRLRPDHTELIQQVDPGDFGLDSAGAIAVVAISSRYCLPCQLWENDLAAEGVPFIKVDVARRPEVVSRYAIRSTPVILAVAPGGAVLRQFEGAPTGPSLHWIRAVAGPTAQAV